MTDEGGILIGYVAVATVTFLAGVACGVIIG